MATNEPLNQTRNRLLLAAWLLYLAAALSYSFVTTIQAKGLGGLFVAWQIKLLGWGSFQLAVLLTMVVCCLPLVLASTVFRVLSPEAEKSFRVYQRAAIYSGFPSPMTWGFVFRIPAAMLLVGALIYGYIFLRDKQEEAMPVYQQTLTSAPSSADPRTGFVERTAIAAEKYTLIFHTGGKMPSTDVFVPVVEPGWTPATPVRYIVHYPAEAYQTGPPNLPYAMVSTTPSVFPGKLSGEMVDGFKQRYTKRGLKVAPDALFLDWVDLFDHHVVPSHDSLLFTGIITGFVTGFTLLILTLAKLQNDRVAARR